MLEELIELDGGKRLAGLLSASRGSLRAMTLDLGLPSFKLGENPLGVPINELVVLFLVRILEHGASDGWVNSSGFRVCSACHLNEEVVRSD
ncbi:unnamed protein product [Cochlearia groenlandica]